MTIKKYHMGANFFISSLSGKWKVSIICALAIKNFRYLELLNYERKQHHISISQKVLTEQLNQLEYDGIIKKHNYKIVPPKVIYSLTPVGHRISEWLLSFNKIGELQAKNSEHKPLFDISADEVKRLHSQKNIG